MAAVNTTEPESRPSLSADGTRLYFGRGVTADIYVSTRVELDDEQEATTAKNNED